MKFWPKLLLVVVVLLGLVLHLTHLSAFLRYDEAASLVATSGYTLEELRRDFSAEPPLQSFADLDAAIAVDNGRHISDTIATFADDDPHLTPAYFVLNRMWMGVFGDSILSLRGLPFLFSLISVVGLYFLCLELFQSVLVGGLAIAFFILSPVFWNFFTFVRFYSLLIALALTSSLVLLRAIKTRSWVLWSLYGVLLSTSFYTYLFAVFVAIAHLAYVWINHGHPFKKQNRGFALALTAASLSFLPWIGMIAQQTAVSAGKTSWLETEMSLLSRLLAWLHNFSLPFFDIAPLYQPESFLTKLLLIKIPDLIGFLFITYAFYFLIKNTQKNIWTFVVLLTVLTILPLIMLDFQRSMILSIVLRYLLPAYLGIVMAIAHLFSAQLTHTSQRHSASWNFLLLCLLTISLLTLGFDRFQVAQQAQFIKTRATVLSQTAESVIVSDNAYYLVELSYQLDPALKAVLLPQQQPLQSLDTLTQTDSSPIYLFIQDPALYAMIEQSNNLVLTPIQDEAGQVITTQLQRNGK